MKNKRRGWVLPIILVASLSGCAMAPGGHISYDSEAEDISHLVNIETITPELVREYQRNINGDVASLMPQGMKERIANYEYRVGPGDVLSVIVYGHPELTTPAGSERSPEEVGNQVRHDGSIFYPYIGRVKVAGKTTDAIRSILTQRLSDIINEPQIEVNVAAFRSKKVYVSGAVGVPKALPITNIPMTVLDAISAVGGASEKANWHSVTLNREGNKEELSLYALLRQGDQTKNRLLQDGDVLHVPSLETQTVAVMGQVRKPGNIQLGNERITLTDALSRAGGVVETLAEPSGIFVLRALPPESEKIANAYQLDISDVSTLAMGTQFPLQPKDVIYVTSAPLARWNNVISLLLPSVALPGTLADTSSEIGNL